MPYEFFIGLRYLRAKRKQTYISINTFISVAGIFIGVAALIIVLAVMNGFETKLREKILGVNSHVVLTRYDGGMKNYEDVIKEVEDVDGVEAATPFIYGQAMLKNQDRAGGVVLRGISTESVLKVINFGKIKEGSVDYLADDGKILPELPGVIIGVELARDMGLILFDTVEVLLPMGIPTPMGLIPRIKKFRVVGIFDSGFYEYDSSLVFMSIENCQKFLNMKDVVTGVEIRIDDVYKAKSVADAIEKRLGPPYWARSWMQMNKNLFSALKLERMTMFIILFLIILVATFNIITTLIMVVMEKTRDIAILKSMGAASKSIMKIFMVQGLIIGAVGTVAGCIAGITVALNLEAVTLFIENLFGFTILPKDVYYLSELPSKVNYTEVAVIAVATLLVCFLATIYPSWRASRLDPAEALRYE